MGAHDLARRYLRAPRAEARRVRVTVTAAGFKRVERDVSVEAGATTTADLTLEIGDVTSSVHNAGDGAAPASR